MPIFSFFRSFLQSKSKSDDEVKEIILKEYFSSTVRATNTIKRAANESAEDQNAILDEYREIEQKSSCR